jgi:hypothetical protein
MMHQRPFTFLTFALVTIILLESRGLISQGTTSTTPRVQLNAAPHLRLTGDVDSNSPGIWQLFDGLPQLLVMTSIDGNPSVAFGPRLERLGAALPVILDPSPGGGVWMEAVIADADGTLYGYFHNENVATMCSGPAKAIPRIGAARSNDRGLTWAPIGVVLEASPRSHDCDTNDEYFVGGVGDFSVQLDQDSRDLYIFYSQYVRWSRRQGVGVARLAWADRDNPTGKVTVFANGVWLPARALTSSSGSIRWNYPSALPIFPTTQPWNDDDTVVDAFWGPSVHWNVYLEQYVMLLNRAMDTNWKQEGVYVSFNRRLDNPGGWSLPVQILSGGNWYPQAIGTEVGTGTDKVAGRLARFFMSGFSDHVIQFIK